MITPIFARGFELGIKELSSVSSSNAPTVVTTDAKTGVRSLNTRDGYGQIDFAATPQFRLGWHWLQKPRANSNGTRHLRLYGGSTLLLELRDQTGVGLSLQILGVERDYSADLSDYIDWRNWGIDFKQDSVNGWAKVYRDGLLVLSFDGNTGSTPTSTLQLGAHSSLYGAEAGMLWDDIYLDATPGEAAPACPPDKRFLWAPATSDVAANWTPSTGASHFAVVDEVPASGTDYLSALSAGLVDTFGVTVPTLPTGFVPGAVWPVATAFKSDGATATQLTLRTTDGVATIDGTSLDLPTTAGVITERFGTQPDGSAWTNAAVAATKYGIVSSGTF